MAKYSPNRNQYNHQHRSTRNKVHQTTVVFDQDTIAFLKQQSRRNADFNRRVSALDRLYSDSSESKYQRLNDYRLKTDSYSRRSSSRVSQSEARIASHRSTQPAPRNVAASRNVGTSHRPAQSTSREAVPSSNRAGSSNRAASTARPAARNSSASGTRNTQSRQPQRSSNQDYNRRPAPAQRNIKKKRKKPSKALVIVLIIVAVLLAFVAFVGVNVVITKNHASHLKDDLEKVLDCAKEKDAEGAEKALLKSYEDKEALAASIDGGFWKTASKIDKVKEELAAGKDLLNVVTTAQDELLSPLVALMKRQPLTNLKVGEDGFNVTLINEYLDFVEEIQPELEGLMSDIMAVNTDSMMGGYVAKYKEKLYEYTDAYNQASSKVSLHFPAAQDFASLEP